MRVAAAAIALLLALPLAADDESDIAKVLDDQAAAWNRGSLLGYMQGYAKDVGTTFVSGDTVTRGWQTVYERYTRKYDTRAKMGTLAFSDINVEVVNAETAIVTGAWELKRESDQPRGRVTLIFRKIGGKWRIVYDHTS